MVVAVAEGRRFIVRCRPPPVSRNSAAGHPGSGTRVRSFSLFAVTFSRQRFRHAENLPNQSIVQTECLSILLQSPPLIFQQRQQARGATEKNARSHCFNPRANPSNSIPQSFNEKCRGGRRRRRRPTSVCGTRSPNGAARYNVCTVRLMTDNQIIYCWCNHFFCRFFSPFQIDCRIKKTRFTALLYLSCSSNPATNPSVRQIPAGVVVKPESIRGAARPLLHNKSRRRFINRLCTAVRTDSNDPKLSLSNLFA